MISFKKMVFLIILFSILSFNNICIAQEESAYEKIKIGLQYTNNFNRNNFHKTWKPENGLKGFIETPFYFGRFQVGIKKMNFEPKKPDIPEFETWFYFLGWGKEFKIIHRLKIYNGINLGNMQMHFEEEESDEGLLDESEMAVELTTRLSFEIYDNLNVNIEGSYQRIFTNEKINLFYTSAGFDYSFKTPKWLKDFLR